MKVKLTMYWKQTNKRFSWMKDQKTFQGGVFRRNITASVTHKSVSVCLNRAAVQQCAAEEKTAVFSIFSYTVAVPSQSGKKNEKRHLFFFY